MYKQLLKGIVKSSSNSDYETDFGVSAKGANPKIGFLKAHRRRAFKKPIFILRIAASQAFRSCWIFTINLIATKITVEIIHELPLL
jgi:hypothetical protein